MKVQIGPFTLEERENEVLLTVPHNYLGAVRVVRETMESQVNKKLRKVATAIRKRKTMTKRKNHRKKMVRLSEPQRAEVLRQIARGVSDATIARAYNVNKTTISRMRRNANVPEQPVREEQGVEA